MHPAAARGRGPIYNQPSDEGSAQPTHISNAMSEEFARQQVIMEILKKSPVY